MALGDSCRHPLRPRGAGSNERNQMPHRPANRGAALAMLATAAALLCTAAPAGAASTLPALDIALAKGSVTVTGSTVSGAVNVVTTTARGLREPSPLLVRLNPGATADELLALLASKAGSDPNNVVKVGSIVFDGEAKAGATTEAQTELAAGSYVALSIEGEGKVAAHQAFTITTASAPAVLPAPSATIRTIEFGFTGPSTIKVGQSVRFENEGFLVHMDIAFPVRSRKAALEAVADFKLGREKGLRKLVAGEPLGLFGPLSHGAFQQETITARPGWYVEACFMDTQDHRQHTQLGMERVLHIVK